MEVHSDIGRTGEAQEAFHVIWLPEEGVKWHLCTCEGSLVSSDLFVVEIKNVTPQS